VKGIQRRLVCPQCGKVFFAWRPDELPGAKVKCYFCGHQFEDDAARRPPVTPPAAPAPAPGAPAAPEVPPAPPEPAPAHPEDVQ